MKLKLVNALIGQRSLIGEQLVQRALESMKTRRIRAEAKIDADGAYGRAIADSETDSMHQVIEVLNVPLSKAKAHALNIGVNVAHVVEQDAADIIAQER